MKTKNCLTYGMIAVSLLCSGLVSGFVRADGQGGGTPSKLVDVAIKCHEGKVSAEDAANQLNDELTNGRSVYASNSWAGDQSAKLLEVRRPFRVSAPTFYNDQGVPEVCVTVTHNK